MLIDSELTNLNRNRVLPGHEPGAALHGAGPGINRTSDLNDASLKVLLSRFEAYGLGDINKANLMHRVDTKYLLPIGDLKQLLPLLTPAYSVLEIGSSRMFAYQSTYYDTSELEFYRMHHNGKKNRFKIRLRRYLDSGDQYVEVKHKSNKSLTHKDRIRFNGGHCNRKRLNDLVSTPFGTPRPPLFKSLVCSYKRISLADEKNGERLTLDFNLSFRDPKCSHAEQSHHVLIAEVKRENQKAPSVFNDLMDLFRQKSVSFSKYCIGCAQIYSNRFKTNRFKPTLMALDRISHKGTLNF
jgi:hypothetical protein